MRLTRPVEDARLRPNLGRHVDERDAFQSEG